MSRNDNTILLLAGAFALWYFMRNKATAATTPPLVSLPPYQYTPPIVPPPIPDIEITDDPVSGNGDFEWLLFPN